MSFFSRYAVTYSAHIAHDFGVKGQRIKPSSLTPNPKHHLTATLSFLCVVIGWCFAWQMTTLNSHGVEHAFAGASSDLSTVMLGIFTEDLPSAIPCLVNRLESAVFARTRRCDLVEVSLMRFTRVALDARLV